MTKGYLIKTTRGGYILSDPSLGKIQGEGDILDLIQLCTEPDLHKILILEGSLPDTFFDLSTGLAGAIALKLNNYKVRAAIVVDLDKVRSERFKEWVSDCTRGKEFHFTADYLEAEDWLLGD